MGARSRVELLDKSRHVPETRSDWSRTKVSDWSRMEGSDWSSRPPARYWGVELISLASGAVGEGRVLLALARRGSVPLVGCVTKKFCFTKTFVSLNFFFTKN